MLTLFSLNPLLTKSLYNQKIHQNRNCISLSQPKILTCRRNCIIRCIDAAQPYDYESKLAAEFKHTTKLKIAIVGFGNYGQFLAKTFVKQGHTVIAHSRSDHSEEARALGVTFFADPDDLCEQHPEIILLSTSVISTERMLKSLPLQRLKRNTLFVDVLSVKEFAKKLLVEVLPWDADVICTHPMFGPESGKNGWRGLYFVYEKVRVRDVLRCEKFVDVFEREECKMVEMSCAEHDVYAAGSQFITHTVGRVLDMLGLRSTLINTKGYETLLELVENTAADSFDLYYGLFVYNKNALEMLHKLKLAFDELKQQLFGRLHEVVRDQLFENGQNVNALPENVKHFRNGATLLSSSNVVRYQDAARPYNSTAPIVNLVDDGSKLKIAIVGFGNFGQFLAKTIVRQGHKVLGYSRSDYSAVAKRLGVSFFSNIDDLCEEHPDVILLSTSILSTGQVLRCLPLQRLKRRTLFVDVLSVKEFPRNLLLQSLPADFDILCTHPMFGPESGKNGWDGLTFVYDKVRVGNDQLRVSRCERFLKIFAQDGCKMVEMTCADHDLYAAGSQFITHTIGRMLEKLNLESIPIKTKGYQTLLNLVENTSGDSFDLYYGLFMYNVNAMEQIERLDVAFESLEKQLFGSLHAVLHGQLIENAEKVQILQEQKNTLTDGMVYPWPLNSQKN